MIDLHCHVLPAVDDGPATEEEALALARVAEAVGIDTIVATPHVSPSIPNRAAMIAEDVDAFNRRLAERGVSVRVTRGAEVDVAFSTGLPDEELHALRLGGGDFLLMECPLTRSPGPFDVVLRELHARGHGIVLAHPERSPALQRRPRLLEQLVDEGMLVQITAGALVGRFGSDVRHFALWLLEEDLVHNVASDAHDPVRRPPGLEAALLTAAADVPAVADQIEWLTREVPAAILGGTPIPERPARPAARPRWSLLRRAVR